MKGSFLSRFCFAGAHVLLADRLEGAFPRLSDRLVEAMQVGRQMVLRFDLLVPQSGRRAPFDGEATVDLHAAGGREAGCGGAPGAPVRRSAPSAARGLRRAGYGPWIGNTFRRIAAAAAFNKETGIAIFKWNISVLDKGRLYHRFHMTVNGGEYLA